MAVPQHPSKGSPEFLNQSRMVVWLEAFAKFIAQEYFIPRPLFFHQSVKCTVVSFRKRGKSKFIEMEKTGGVWGKNGCGKNTWYVYETVFTGGLESHFGVV